MSQELPPCTVEGCDRPTQEYLCHQCTDELTTAWDQIDDLLPVLQSIGRGEDSAFTQPAAEGRGGATGSKPPGNWSAMSTAICLQQALVFTPAEYAQHADGWMSHRQILDWVTQANAIVHGEEEKRLDPIAVNWHLRDIHPMPGKELVTWFNNELGIQLTLGRIRKWAHNGHIKPTNTHGHPKYHPAAVFATYCERKQAAPKPR